MYYNITLIIIIVIFDIGCIWVAAKSLQHPNLSELKQQLFAFFVIAMGVLLSYAIITRGIQ